MIADPAGSAWTFGGSILTFAFPMLLFIVVACALYIAYTKPELVPGHRNPAAQRAVSLPSPADEQQTVAPPGTCCSSIPTAPSNGPRPKDARTQLSRRLARLRSSRDGRGFVSRYRAVAVGEAWLTSRGE